MKDRGRRLGKQASGEQQALEGLHERSHLTNKNCVRTAFYVEKRFNVGRFSINVQCSMLLGGLILLRSDAILSSQRGNPRSSKPVFVKAGMYEAEAAEAYGIILFSHSKSFEQLISNDRIDS